jgi:Fe-S cluster assembly iron-binding protein IscA
MKGLLLSYCVLITTLPLTNTNCSKAEKTEQQSAQITVEQRGDIMFKDQKGVVRIYVCTRGCYQYVLETEFDGKLLKLSPDVLDEAFKKDNLTVIFSGKMTQEMVDIKKPSPNDIPILDFKVPKVLVENIKVAN